MSTTPADWHRIAAENATKPRFGLSETLERLASNDAELTTVQMEGWTHVLPDLLANSMLHNNCLVHLSLKACRLGDNGVKKLCHVLEVKNRRNTRTPPPLRHLDLAGNAITDTGAVALGRVLGQQHNTLLEELILCWNGIADVGAQAIANALRTNTTLKKLDLGGIREGRGGGRTETYFLQTDQLACNCNIGDVGCCALAEALPHCRLESLTLSRQNISSRGITALGLCLVSHPNCKVKHLELQRIPVDDVGAVSLAAAIRCGRLQSLQLTINKITDRGAMVLADAITSSSSSSSSLREISLTQSAIGLAGLKALADAVCINTTLQCFDVYGHAAGREGSKHVWTIKPWLRFNRKTQSILRDKHESLYPYILAKAGRLKDPPTRLYILLREMQFFSAQIATK